MFTIRFWSDASISTSKSVSSLQITSEQCDDQVQAGLPTNATFNIGDSSLLIECLYGNNGACQIYVESTTSIMFNPENINTRRRLSPSIGDCCARDDGCESCSNGYVCLYENSYECPDTNGCACLYVELDSKACFPAGIIVNILCIGVVFLLSQFS